MLSRTYLVYSLDPPLMFPGLSVRVAAFVIDFILLLVLDVLLIAVVGFPVGLIRGLDVQGLALIELGPVAGAPVALLRVVGVVPVLRDAGRDGLPPQGGRRRRR